MVGHRAVCTAKRRSGKRAKAAESFMVALDSKAAEAKKIDEDQHVTKPGKDLWEDWSVCTPF